MNIIRTVSYYISILITLINKFGVCQDGSFHCSTEFCVEKTRLSPCPDEVRNCSTTGFRTFLDPSECNCCSYCFDYLKEDDICTPSTNMKPVEMCGPFLTCVPSTSPSEPSKCKTMEKNPRNELDETFCMTVRKKWLDMKEDGTLGIVQFLPECDAGGNYAPRQCIEGSLCYCSNNEGQKIFGEALPGEHQDCACARDVARLQSFGFHGKMPHCLPNGDYDELQCAGRSCFCRSFPNTVQDIANMTRLRCFDETRHVFKPSESTYYLKECELKRAEYEIEIGTAELDGDLMMISDMPNCTPDGNYAAVQTSFASKYCAEPEFGDQLEDFNVGKFSDEGKVMNCYCARARHLLRESATGKPQCCRNGNFRPWQRIGSRYYCVDEYGRQDISREPYEVYESKLDELPCYKEYMEQGDKTCELK